MINIIIGGCLAIFALFVFVCLAADIISRFFDTRD